MANRDYAVVVMRLSDEDGGGFYAYVPDLPGCIGDGETQESAIADVQSAIDEWLDETRRLDRPVPVPGDCFVKVKAEQAKAKELIKAQEALIGQLERRLDQRDKDLRQAREEIDRIKASMEPYTIQTARDPRHAWDLLGAIPAHIAAGNLRRHHGHDVN